jgi:tetratricopeptide (TPR) repeat protein
MAAYDAFISYSHAKDKPLAAAVQAVIQKLGKPWYRRRALHLFRDDTSLSATPALWSSIERALSNSRYFILLASPEAAASQWVAKEVSYWLANKGTDTLLIGLTHGELEWDGATNDFVRHDGVPLPHVLAGKFTSEPKWIDLRGLRDRTHAGDSRLIEAGADFAAAIHGVPKEDLLSQEVHQQRRALMLAWSAVSLLVALAGAAAWQWHAAITQRDRAEAALARAEILIGGASKSTLLIGDMFDSGILPTTVAHQILDVLRGTLSSVARERVDASITPAQLRLLDILSRSHLAVGDTHQALHVAEAGLGLASQLIALDQANDDWQKLLADAHTRVGAALRRRGNASQALVQFQSARSIAARLAATNPDNRKWQRDLALILEIISDTLKAQGDLQGAFAENDASMAIYSRLGSSWDVANSLLRSGDIYWDKGDLSSALQSFRKALAINAGPAQESTPSIEPERNWKWSAALSYLRLGNALRIKGDWDEAVMAYRQYMRISLELESRDPKNEIWQRHRARSHAMIGDALFAKGDHAGALREYESVRSGARHLLDKDPRNRLVHQELSESHRRIGDVLLAQANFDAALDHFEITLQSAIELARADNSNIVWQEDLAIAHERKGDALRGQGRLDAALTHYQAAVGIADNLLRRQRFTRSTWKQALARNHGRIGSVLAAQKRFVEARAALRDCLAVELAETSFDLRNSAPSNVHEDCQRQLASLQQ